eukprot:349738-Chlamydomonas_euryale.AAC.1
MLQQQAVRLDDLVAAVAVRRDLQHLNRLHEATIRHVDRRLTLVLRAARQRRAGKGGGQPEA